MTEILQLPAVITSYLAAHRIDDADGAVAAFTDDATVTDEGVTRRGPAEIREWISTAASEYTYTSELIATRRIDADHWIATHHLEGNFPGGVVDLHYDFTLRDGRIQDLTIAP